MPMMWRGVGVAEFVTISFGRWLVGKNRCQIGITRFDTLLKGQSVRDIDWCELKNVERDEAGHRRFYSVFPLLPGLAAPAVSGGGVVEVDARFVARG